jgi:Zn-dependent protease with chaperone function
MKTSFYPLSPLSIPVGFTQPSSSYKRQTLVAAAAVILFVLVYLGLSTWFLWKAAWLLINVFSGGNDQFLSLLLGGIMGFLGIFMFKAFFFLNKKNESRSIEVKPEDEPELFDFIYRIADEAKAPRPYKVFISDAVNACVFYHISIINLIFPSRKNLEIGLGLVNTLNISEFKSILAHEFGHFTQRSMIIGRWVYIAQQVAHAIVSKRDGFDAFLNGISRIDIRIAWVGWLLSIAVWCIRSIAETFFYFVLLTQRALSREMEFHADLVSVSLSGSDSLVHSLYKLGAADEAYDAAISFTNKALRKGKKVTDIFSIQANYLQKISVIRNNAQSSALSDLKNMTGVEAKVFKVELAQAPKMWSTHPSNIDREKNAKKTYIKSEIDNTSSWVLFKDKEEISKKITLSLYENLKDDLTELSSNDGVELHNKEFLRSFLKKEYQGVYLERQIMLSVANIGDLYDPTKMDPNIMERWKEMYPPSIQHDLEVLKALAEEQFMLEGLKTKNLDAYEGEIVYNGEKIQRKDLPQVINQVEKKIEEVRGRVDAHDQLCRQVHYSFALKLGKGWPEYLASIGTIIHNYDHTRKNIEDLQLYFYRNLQVVSKKSRMGSNDLYPLLSVANTLHEAMEGFFKSAETIPFSGSLTERLGGKQPSELTTKFTLGLASQSNINDWINVLPQWVELCLEQLSILRDAALDELLYVEEYLKESVLKGEINVRVAPIPINMHLDYPKYDRNNKREVKYKVSLFNKFMSADGLFPTIGRLGVAASIILFAIFFSMSIGGSRIIIYNGLPIDVMVKLGKKEVQISANGSNEIEIDNRSKMKVIAEDMSGHLIESFEASMKGTSSTYVYNVAGASLLYSYEAVYGASVFGEPAVDIIGAPRWLRFSADYYFMEPPSQLSVKAGTTETKKVLDVVPAHPMELAGYFKKEEEFIQWVSSHLVWEPSKSMYLNDYFGLAMALPNIDELINRRLELDSMDISALRLQQEIFKDQKKDSICNLHHSKYMRSKDNPDFYYLQTRCMENGPEQDSLFLQGQHRWPENPWLAYASAFIYTKQANWSDANKCYSVGYNQAPQLKESIWEEKKRIQQYLGSTETSSFDELRAPFYLFITAVESSDETRSTDTYYAFKYLQKGEIDKALEHCISDTLTYPMVLRLAAVSEGATTDIQDKAYFLPESSGINNATIIPAIGLNIKRGESYHLYKEPLASMISEGYDEFIEFIELVEKKKINEANALMPSFNAEFKGKAGLLGMIVLGNSTPAKWKEYASKLLFTFEKPYLKELSSGNEMIQ